MRLHQDVIDMTDGHDLFRFPTRFDQTAITEITAESKIALGRTCDEFNRRTVKGIDPHSHRF